MRTEKSPLRIACSAWSNYCEGSGFPLVWGLILVRRLADGAAGPRSLMAIPSRKCAFRIEHVRADFLQHQIARPISNQAKYRKFFKCLGSRKFGTSGTIPG